VSSNTGSATSQRMWQQLRETFVESEETKNSVDESKKDTLEETITAGNLITISHRIGNRTFTNKPLAKIVKTLSNIPSG